MSRLRNCFILASAFAFSVSVWIIANLLDAEAKRGPCKIAAPTTPDVNLFVSDLDRAVAWYRDKVGLSESRRSFDFGRGRIETVQMKRDDVGVTLVFSPANHGALDQQFLCFVFGGPPAPPMGSEPVYLQDPDGVFVELAPLLTNTQSGK